MPFKPFLMSKKKKAPMGLSFLIAGEIFIRYAGDNLPFLLGRERPSKVSAVFVLCMIDVCSI